MLKGNRTAFAIFVIGICVDVFGSVLFTQSSELFVGDVIPKAFLTSIAAVFFCVLIAGATWAWNASWSTVLAIVGIFAGILVLFGTFVTLRFDDPRVVVFPFCLFIAIALFVSRLIAHVKSAIQRKSGERQGDQLHM